MQETRGCRGVLLALLLVGGCLEPAMAQTNSDAPKRSSDASVTRSDGEHATAIVAASSQSMPKPAASAMRDGSHDFDFLYGKWRMPNHRLVKRLAGSHQWADFVSCDEGMPLPGGLGDMDIYRTSYWKDFVGMTTRTYDPDTGLWRLYWFDNRFSHGIIESPVVGKFNGNVGVFEGPDTFNGKPIIVRFTWTRRKPGV